MQPMRDHKPRGYMDANLSLQIFNVKKPSRKYFLPFS